MANEDELYFAYTLQQYLDFNGLYTDIYKFQIQDFTSFLSWDRTFA